MSRRNLEETRTLLLDTGVDMLVGSGTDVTIGKLDLTEVSTRAGMASAGSAYKIWPDQDAYRRDLLRHFLDRSFNIGSEDFFADMVDFEPTTAPTLDALIRSFDDRTPEERATESANFAAYVALWLAALHDDDLATSLETGDSVSLNWFTELYAAATVGYGLEFIPPLTPLLFAIVANAAVEGFDIHRAVHPAVAQRELTIDDDDGNPRTWTLLSCTLRALVDAFTRPITETPA
ncbi:MAG: hypothetical protein JST73_00980 [Actinobacteria bacterium]|nr:hypothetical protein [Actinomycetota bacterium]